MKRTLTALLLMLVLVISTDAIKALANAEKVDVHLTVESAATSITSRYDVDVYLDNEFIATLKYGKKIKTVISTLPGEHTLRFEKTGDPNIQNKIVLTSKENWDFVCSIKTNTNDIRISSKKNEKFDSEVKPTIKTGWIVTFERNLVFSKYDVKMFIDNTLITVIGHGKTYQGSANLAAGEHLLRFVKTDNYDVYGEVTFTVSEDRNTFEYTIHSHSGHVDIKNGIIQNENSYQTIRPRTTIISPSPKPIISSQKTDFTQSGDSGYTVKIKIYYETTNISDKQGTRRIPSRIAQKNNPVEVTFLNENDFFNSTKVEPIAILNPGQTLVDELHISSGKHYFLFDNNALSLRIDRDGEVSITITGNPFSIKNVNNTSNSTTPTPKPTVAVQTIPPRIKSGDKGEIVKALQDKLSRLYYLSPDEATGKYDAKTVQAVKDFQVVNDIKETGICDEETWHELLSPHAFCQEIVYKSKSGKVYHAWDDCSGMRNPTEMKLSTAIRKGLKPCEHCY